MLFSKKQNLLSDDELIIAYKANGNTAILGVLYSRYMTLVFGCCLKYLKNRPDAQDATMQIFELLMDKLKSHEVKQFKSWLFVVTRNHCLMHLRSAGKQIRLDIEDQFMKYDDNFHLEGIINDEQTVQQLDFCMAALQKLQQKGIYLFFIENLSYKSICEQMNLDLKKVKSLIQNGKRNLRICLEGKGVKGISSDE